MRVLSIRQPWATLIMLGIKQFETRRWRTDYRGELVIHAAATGGQTSTDALMRLERRIGAMPTSLVEKDYPLGALLGIVQLDECLPISPRLIAALTPLERQLGWYQDGGFVWDLARAGRVRFAEPIPCAGRLGLWTLSADLVAQVEQEVHP
ncbi:MAG TPA: ASCH domain-containing protein [Nitrospira sp.]|nr:ASCH domain-containing protein [Nitrospira sp.]